MILEQCEPLWEGDDHGGQGHCGQEFDIETQWSTCPHNVIDGPASRKDYPPLPWPRAYRYISENLKFVWQTSVPKNDLEALDYFTKVASWFEDIKPKYVMRKDNGAPDREFKPLPFEYDWRTDEWSDRDG